MEIKKIRREDNRIFGGVCSGISKKYNVYLWITRLTFVIASWLLLVPFLIYLGLWIAIPSRNQFKITDRVRLQPIGIVVGWIIGFLIYGYIFSTDSMKSQGPFAMLIMIPLFLLIPLGAIIGFFIARLSSVKIKLT